MGRNPNTMCDRCGVPFYCKPSHMKKRKYHYCSRKCYIGNRARTTRNFNCLICKKEFTSKNENPKYCSRTCSNVARRGIFYTGEQSKSKVTISQKLKFEILKFKNNECEICKLPPIWNNIPLILQVDHIDGDRHNNNINNLRLLCPNCHSQTETFGAKNINRKKKI